MLCFLEPGKYIVHGPFTRKGQLMAQQLYSLNEVFQLTGVKYHRVYHAFRTGQLPEPAKVGRTRVFTEDDVKRIKAHFAEKDKGAK